MQGNRDLFPGPLFKVQTAELFDQGTGRREFDHPVDPEFADRMFQIGQRLATAPEHRAVGHPQHPRGGRPR